MRQGSIVRLAAGTTAAGFAALAYAALIERNLFTLRRFDVPVLAPEAEPLRVLHVSDLHLLPRHRRRAAWVRGLAALQPDLVVSTGDHLSSIAAVPLLADALGALPATPPPRPRGRCAA